MRELVVEVYLLELKLSLMESDKSATCEFSASDTTGVLFVISFFTASFVTQSCRCCLWWINSEIRHCCMCFTEKVEAKVRQLFDIAVNREIRLWMKFTGNTFEILEQGKSLQEAGVYRGMVSWCAFGLLLKLKELLSLH